MTPKRPESFEGIRDHFNTPVAPMTWVLLIGGFVVLGVILVLIHRRQQSGQGSGRPRSQRRLFKELLRSLPLTFRQRELLRRVARDLKLSMPAAILLSPAHLDTAVRRWSRDSGEPSPRHAELFGTISQNLFEEVVHPARGASSGRRVSSADVQNSP
jgi:hypothetical protein